MLDALVMLFSQHGFEASSLSEIVEAAGLNRSSLYNTFGSKEQLFERVLDRYISHREQLLDLVTSRDGGLDDLIDLVELLRSEAMSTTGHLGCLAINSTAELGDDHQSMVTASQRYRDMLRDHIRRPLVRAADRDEIRADMVEVYVDAAVSFVIATALTARGGASLDELNRHLDSMRALVESWRLAD